MVDAVASKGGFIAGGPTLSARKINSDPDARPQAAGFLFGRTATGSRISIWTHGRGISRSRGLPHCKPTTIPTLQYCISLQRTTNKSTSNRAKKTARQLYHNVPRTCRVLVTRASMDLKMAEGTRQKCYNTGDGAPSQPAKLFTMTNGTKWGTRSMDRKCATSHSSCRRRRASRSKITATARISLLLWPCPRPEGTTVEERLIIMRVIAASTSLEGQACPPCTDPTGWQACPACPPRQGPEGTTVEDPADGQASCPPPNDPTEGHASPPPNDPTGRHASEDLVEDALLRAFNERNFSTRP